MIIPIIAGTVSIFLLVWSAGRFVDGSATLAARLGMPSLMIGMVIVGFGTSAPELMVSVLAAWQGQSGIALGNAYGSNIANIALILGLTAAISPIAVHSRVLKIELPVLTLTTFFAVWLLADGGVSRSDGFWLLAIFAMVLGWTILQGIRRSDDALGPEVALELAARPKSLRSSVVSLVVGFPLLIASSRLLVWSAVEVARGLGVGEVIIGLTIVAVGTSLPELASSIAAARRGEHDLALGNVLGSNLFNTLAVVGVAAVVRPLDVAPEMVARDIPVLIALTVALFLIAYGFRGPGRISRFEGFALMMAYFGYLIWLVI